MRVAFESDGQGLRRRGRPVQEIPQEVRDAADRTYQAKQVGRVDVGPGEEAEARQLVRMLQRYAKACEKRITVQRTGTILRFQMRDREG